MGCEGSSRTRAYRFFNLACYAAQLGNLDEAKEHLARAIDLDRGIRMMVLDEPDLEPLWESWV